MGKYTEHDMVRIESVYQNFVDKFIEGKLQNFEKIEATINVHIDAQAFIVNVRENRQKNSSGGSRKIRRRRLNLEEKQKIALLAKQQKNEEKEEADDDDENDDANDDNDENAEESNLKILSPTKLTKQKSAQIIICPLDIDEHQIDDSVWSSFDAPLNSLMSAIIDTT